MLIGLENGQAIWMPCGTFGYDVSKLKREFIWLRLFSFALTQVEEVTAHIKSVCHFFWSKAGPKYM